MKSNEKTERACRIELLKVQLVKTANEIRKEIIDLVKAKGGFLNTANNDGKNDNIYGARYAGNGTLEVIEVKVKALMVVEGLLFAYCVPSTETNIEYTDEDMKADNDSWVWLDVSSDVLYASMMHSLADVFGYGEYF